MSKIISSRQSCIDTLTTILEEEHFPVSAMHVNGVIDIIDQISDYYEEGSKLYPEVIIVSSRDMIMSYSGRFIRLYAGKIEENQFKKAMKLCAPLAVDNWNIYIILKDTESIEYGIISTEEKETSLSLRNIALSQAETDDHLLYIRNVGGKNVELARRNDAILISLSLQEYVSTQDDNIAKLVDSIINDLQNNEEYRRFIHKVILDALNEGHGNLIAVCKEEDLDGVIANMTGGAILKPFVDIPKLINEDKEEGRSETSVAIKSMVSVVKHMMNHDGITIFSTRGKVMAFHYIIDNSRANDPNVVGGARTKAFDAMKKITELHTVFFKSQEGLTKIFSHE